MIRVTILGCGSSGGVPRIGGNWGACDPENPKNRRRRCSILIENISSYGRTQVLVDTGPDLVPQLLDAGIITLDAVIWTHSHADHIHGIDDLRQVAYNAHNLVKGFADERTMAELENRFSYIFTTPPGSHYSPVCDLHLFNSPLDIPGNGGSLTIIPFTVEHGNITALGLKIPTSRGGIIYLPDVHSIPVEAWEIIDRPEIFICDALRNDPHPSHAHLALTLEWFARTGTQQGILTNMHIDLDYAATNMATPDHIVPAYDGMVLEVGE